MSSEIKTINIKGKAYVEVAERVRLVHDQKRAFEVVESGPYTIADRVLWKVVILVDDKKFTGNAEVKLTARKGSPDDTNPMECAETSALGRALGFAGFGLVESIASFDEVARAITSQGSAEQGKPQQQAPRQQPTNNTTPAMITEQQIASIRKLCQHLNREEPEGLTEKSYLVAKRLIEQMTGEYRNLQAPTSTANAPEPSVICKRCVQLSINLDQLVTKVLKSNIPSGNWTPENCAKLARALDIIEEQWAKKKAS